MLHKVTKTSGYQIFSHGLQLPHSAIAADPHNLFNPLTQWHLALPLQCKRIPEDWQVVCRNATLQQKNPSETGTETRQPAYCNLCPPPPWRDMQPLCHVKEIISKTVWVKWHIGSGSCQFQGKLNKVKNCPDRKRKAISRGKGRETCIVLVLLRLFFIGNMTLVCGVTILALHESNRPSAEAEKATGFCELFRVNPVQQVQPDSIKKGNPPHRILLWVLIQEVLITHKNYFLNAFLNHCVNEAKILPKIFNYYVEILSETAHITC